MSSLDIGEKPLAQWTMSTGSPTPPSTKLGYSIDVSALKPDEKQSSGLFSWWKKGSERKCTLQNAHKHGWKPETMRAPALLTFAVASILLAVLLEVLARQSQKAGGLSLVKDPESLSAMVTFGYLYLPTVIAVIYSLVWGWVDLDMKRLQPWLNLSNKEGDTAENTLFLDYPYYFFAWVPIAAAKRRHWIVCISGSITALIMIVITPLQSAAIGAGLVNIETNVTFSAPSPFISSENQSVLMDQSVINSAFAVTWLDQAYPAFTTDEFALRPMNVNKPTSIRTGSTFNMTGTTTKYATDLHCWPAIVKRDLPVGKLTYNFDNGQGCNISQVDPLNSRTGDRPYRILYIGYHNSAWADYSLGSPSCSKNSTNQFLAIWSRFLTAEDDEIVANFCETSYYKQNVSVTVSVPDYAPRKDSVVALGPKEPIPDTEFNVTAFEYLLSSGVSSVIKQRDLPTSHLVEQYPRLAGEGMSWPVSPMVGFAVGSQNYSVKELRNDTLLTEGFRISHRTLFAVAMHMMSSNTTSPDQSTTGSVTYQMFGVIISRPFSIGIECLLIFVAILVLVLVRVCQATPSKLSDNPASVSALMDVVRHSPDLLSEFSGKGTMSEENLQKFLGTRKFKLQCACEDPSNAMTIREVGAGVKDLAGSEKEQLAVTDTSPAGYYRPIQPIALRRDIGVGFIVALLAVIAVISYFKNQEIRLGGLIRPSDNFEVLQLLENYIPTALATLIEPFWVLLNRFLCVLQPFKDMWDGPKNASNTVNAKYTSIPPQLAIVRAAASRHFLLAVVCLVSISCNILAVGLSGLFNELPVRVPHQIPLQYLASPRITNESLYAMKDLVNSPLAFSYEDHFYVALANLTSNTALPPWISQEFFFQPFVSMDKLKDNKTDIFQGITRGFGIDPSCTPFTSTTQPPSLDLRNFKADNGLTDAVNCSDVFESEFLRLDGSSFAPRGPSALEISDQLTPYSGLTPCQKVYIAGWARTAEGSKANGTVESSFAVCYPRFRTALFNVTVTPQGRIISASRKSEFEDNLGYAASNNQTDMIISWHNLLMRYSSPSWHNDTLSRDWLSHMIKLKTGSPATLDPKQPPPAINDMVPVIDDIFKRLFALLLGLNSNVFVPDASLESFTGVRVTPEIRIFMPMEAFIICIVVLSLNVITATLYYGRAIKHFLPRLPTSIGSILAYIAPSKAVREYQSGSNMTFGFGRYTGNNGKAQIGVEASKYVVPVKLESLRKGDTAPKTSFWGTFRRRKQHEKLGDTWL